MSFSTAFLDDIYSPCIKEPRASDSSLILYKLTLAIIVTTLGVILTNLDLL